MASTMIRRKPLYKVKCARCGEYFPAFHNRNEVCEYCKNEEGGKENV